MRQLAAVCARRIRLIKRHCAVATTNCVRSLACRHGQRCSGARLPAQARPDALPYPPPPRAQHDKYGGSEYTALPLKYVIFVIILDTNDFRSRVMCR
jgi:hypothetical protein